MGSEPGHRVTGQGGPDDDVQAERGFAPPPTTRQHVKSFGFIEYLALCFVRPG